MRIFNLISTISTCFYKRFKIHWFLSGVNWNQVVWYSLHQDVAMALKSQPPLSGCFESFSYSGQFEVRSGTMTTCCVVNANMDQSGDPGNQYCMTKHGSSYPQIVYCLRVSGVELSNGWAYIKWSRLPRNTEASRFLSARQIAQNQTLSKKFPTKHNAMPMTRGKDKRLTWP